MPRQSPFRLRSHLFVLVHTGTGIPYAARLNVRRLSQALSLLVAIFSLSVLGSLFFFRELETNRKLTERILELETHDRLAHEASLSPRAVAAQPAAESGIPANAPDAKAAPAPEAPKAPVTVAAAAPAAAPEAPVAATGARLVDITAGCQGEDCQVKFTMVPIGAGTASGELLVVLETEIPRIGGGHLATQQRKRFYLYPGNESRDELSDAALQSLDRKPFRFSRALHTTAHFKIGKLLRPLAANIYVYDKNKVLLRHERATIETPEE